MDWVWTSADSRRTARSFLEGNQLSPQRQGRRPVQPPPPLPLQPSTIHLIGTYSHPALASRTQEERQKKQGGSSAIVNQVLQGPEGSTGRPTPNVVFLTRLL